MVESWRGFRALFTLVEAKLASMDLGSLQKIIFKRRSIGFEEETSQKVFPSTVNVSFFEIPCDLSHVQTIS